MGRRGPIVLGRKLVRSPGRRSIAFGFIDQAFSSATNFGLSLIAGRLLGPSGLGEVFLGFSIYLVALGLQRRLLTEPLVASTAGADVDRLRETTGLSLTVAIAAGLVASVAAIAAGLMLPGLPGSWVPADRPLVATDPAPGRHPEHPVPRRSIGGCGRERRGVVRGHGPHRGPSLAHRNRGGHDGVLGGRRCGRLRGGAGADRRRPALVEGGGAVVAPGRSALREVERGRRPHLPSRDERSGLHPVGDPGCSFARRAQGSGIDLPRRSHWWYRLSRYPGFLSSPVWRARTLGGPFAFRFVSRGSHSGRRWRTSSLSHWVVGSSCRSCSGRSSRPSGLCSGRSRSHSSSRAPVSAWSC